ncbi:MAG: UbiA-like protein EboC [Microscillaceae bacterium]|nr:UbiA-like protein EboC [Microscillaceae bacterium]
MQTLMAYLRLMRPANLPTALADIWLGYAASGSLLKFSGFFNYTPIDFVDFHWLCWATLGLYAGGVVMNDVFDYALDKVERPERPLPSGKASRPGATMLGFALLAGGIGAAAQVNFLSFYLALAIAGAVLLYDGLAKHHVFLGPFTMGLCRAGNLALGISLVPERLAQVWFLLLIPLLFIGAVTLVSQGEVHGGTKKPLWLAALLYLIVALMVLGLGLWSKFHLLWALPFLLLWLAWVLPPLWKALRTLEARYLMKAVKAGVLSLIILDASLAAGFVGVEFGVLTLGLLPLSLALARAFAVT